MWNRTTLLVGCKHPFPTKHSLNVSGSLPLHAPNNHPSLPTFNYQHPSPLLHTNSYLMSPASTVPSSMTVCVMDASSHLGAALVEKLIKGGYIVHAATFNTDGLDRLRGLWSENKQFKPFISDPLDYHSIVNALRGCSGLFYCLEHSSYDEVTVEVEVRGAHNVLEACAQTYTMEKVVFTSSVTAVIWKEGHKEEADFDERDWSEPIFCRKNKLWHALAKALSEKTAWALAMDRGVHMLSINAGLLTGPELSAKSPYLKGAPEMFRDGVLVTVDVDFLVDAHICAFESQSAYGRYLCFNRAVCRPEDAIKLAQMLAPSCSTPARSDDLRVSQQRIQNKKMQKMMVEMQAADGGSAAVD